MKAKVVLLAASTLETARLMLLSKSSSHPNGIGNSSGHVGHNFCEHIMGPSVAGFMPELVGKPRTLDDGRPGGFYIPRFRNLDDEAVRISSAATASKAAAACGMIPGTRLHDARLRRRVQEARARLCRCRHFRWAASAKCCPAMKTTSRSIPR